MSQIHPKNQPVSPHQVTYCLAWVVKRHKPVLVGTVATDCRKLIEAKCALEGWQILELDVQPSYVYLTLEPGPSIAPETAIKKLKRLTAIRLKRKYPGLKKLPGLWPNVYIAITLGKTTKATVRQQIEQLKGD